MVQVVVNQTTIRSGTRQPITHNITVYHLYMGNSYHGMGDNILHQKGCTRLAPASDNVYQLLAHGPGTLASSTTKTGRHDIAEILLKVALKHKKSINQSIITDKK